MKHSIKVLEITSFIKIVITIRSAIISQILIVLLIIHLIITLNVLFVFTNDFFLKNSFNRNCRCVTLYFIGKDWRIGNKETFSVDKHISISEKIKGYFTASDKK